MRLVHDGKLNLNKMEDHTEEELRTILGRCGANITPASTKVGRSVHLPPPTSLFCHLSSMCVYVKENMWLLGLSLAFIAQKKKKHFTSA